MSGIARCMECVGVGEVEEHEIHRHTARIGYEYGFGIRMSHV